MFRTRSQLPPGSSAARHIFLNDYSLYPESFSDRDLILRASAAAGHNTRWINASIRRNPPTCVSSIVFEFTSTRPPDNNAKRSLPTLSEWNVDVDSSDDIFDLNELEEFKSTDLTFLNLGSTPKRSHLEGSLQEPLPKRRKLDVASLRNAIPQPHVLPSMTPTSTKKSSVTPYAKTKPIPIPPHTLPFPDPLPYTRRSWVIPVRGSLPWCHATAAVVLLESSDAPEPPDPNTHGQIAWTVAALGSFWSFLTLIRDKGIVGPLGLSFHVSQNVSSDSQPTYPELSGMGAQPLTPDIGTAASIVSSSRQVVLPLNLIDHIKVYHDATISMQLRNLLDAWAFEYGESGTPKIRLLKGSRLVLLDERMKGILVS
ncbi:hypothetical protein B0H19DRAFT_1099889 [Mycena capillaripes]|nr:hypothetical protein B0H19DRAFT_1099889 [Mycena capillaripes]